VGREVGKKIMSELAFAARDVRFLVAVVGASKLHVGFPVLMAMERSHSNFFTTSVSQFLKLVVKVTLPHRRGRPVKEGLGSLFRQQLLHPLVGEGRQGQLQEVVIVREVGWLAPTGILLPCIVIIIVRRISKMNLALFDSIRCPLLYSAFRYSFLFW